MKTFALLSRICGPAALSLLAAVAVAQQRPADLQPLPDVPPPPPMVESPDEPQVNIVTRGKDKVEEYRVNGKLYMMKVTPPHGKAYYLIDREGKGVWTPQDGVASRLSVPMWVLGTF
jgi:hypothetical protein